MNASVGLVIVDGEMNVSLSWTGDYPPVLLADQLRLNSTVDDHCNNFGRIASIGKSHGSVVCLARRIDID